jgi:hypothetical protein
MWLSKATTTTDFTDKTWVQEHFVLIREIRGRFGVSVHPRLRG